ncbi:DNA gyrase inhibitor YacG [Parasphingorhabdus sp.]|uniref:DNA gyrase inhibitor YacG n=1 Tax=Parasphingorhabdus sp. TaxID=2709688 RepID=UPI003A8CACE0
MAGTKAPKCPVCRNAGSEKWAPFCSAGCKDRDLLKWLGDGYKIPGPAVSPDQLADHFADDSGRSGEG